MSNNISFQLTLPPLKRELKEPPVKGAVDIRITLPSDKLDPFLINTLRTSIKDIENVFYEINKTVEEKGKP